MKLKILKELDEEHRIIEQLSGSLVYFVRKVIQGSIEKPAQELAVFCDYLSQLLENYHFKKESDILFKKLETMGIPRKTGPIYYYEIEHDDHNGYIRTLKELSAKENWDVRDKQVVLEAGEKFCAEVWEHIDKEDSVMFPEMDERIKGRNSKEVIETHEAFEKNYDRISLLKKAHEFISKYPPVDQLSDVIRGDGCMSCRHYGEGCSGIEHEWWTEHEWEDFFARNNRD